MKQTKQTITKAQHPINRLNFGQIKYIASKHDISFTKAFDILKTVIDMTVKASDDTILFAEIKEVK